MAKVVVKTEFECAACKVTKGRILFTARQWKKRNQGKAKCIACCENVCGLEMSSSPLSSTDLAALHELIQAQSSTAVSVKNTSTWLLDHLPHAAPFFKQAVMRQKFSPKAYFGVLRAIHKVFQGRDFKVETLASTWKDLVSHLVRVLKRGPELAKKLSQKKQVLIEKVLSTWASKGIYTHKLLLTTPERDNKAATKTTTDDKDEDKAAQYNNFKLFIGQLPYDTTEGDLREHFRKGGVGEVKRIRMLRDRHTNQFHGTAFCDFANGRQVSRALRLHKSLFESESKKRIINIERTCGGGGRGEARKRKLEDMKEMQGVKVREDLQQVVQEVIGSSEGSVTKADVDDKVLDILEDFAGSHFEQVKNRAAYFMGTIKRYREALESGEDWSSFKRRKPLTGDEWDY